MDGHGQNYIPPPLAGGKKNDNLGNRSGYIKQTF